MKKVVLMMVTIGIVLGLSACIPTSEIPNYDITTTLTETELQALIEETLQAQDNYYSEEELQAIIDEYVQDSLVATTLTNEELSTLISQLIVDSSVSTIYTQAELEVLIEQLIAAADIQVNYDLASMQEEVRDMLASVKTGVLGVVNQTNDPDVSYSGSGVIYKHEGDYYYMVTNEHVVTDAQEIGIIYEKNGLLFSIEPQYVEILGSDTTTDIAVLRFTSDEDFAVIEFADSYEIEIGDFVFAIGNPLGFDYYGTVTMGVISGIARYVTNDDFNATLLQHDASISPGNSGGALLNIYGQLIGINNMKIVEDDVTGIGFAIPSNTVKRVVEDLEDDGIISRPYLGVSSSVQVNACGLDYGVCITVLVGGAAEAAELQDGDIVTGWINITTGMTEFLDINNFNDLREAILNSSVGDVVQLRYVRDGVEYTSKETTLNLHPDDQ